MNPWNWNADRNLWLNKTTGETITVVEWDNARCKRIAQLEDDKQTLFNAWYECPEDTVPELLQMAFSDIELR